MPWLHEHQPGFPHPNQAFEEPNGLLAAGGDLSPEWLLLAYQNGIFPWYSEGEPILWWSPDPRAVILPGGVHVSRSLQKTLKKQSFEIQFDSNFEAVIEACSSVERLGQFGTWLTEDMKAAYCQMHELGYAHSVECWQDGELVGGFYGLAIGKCFFGESMFSLERDASKVALVTFADYLWQRDYQLIDCQVSSPHILSLGAVEIPRHDFLNLLARGCTFPSDTGKWSYQQ